MPGCYSVSVSALTLFGSPFFFSCPFHFSRLTPRLCSTSSESTIGICSPRISLNYQSTVSPAQLYALNQNFLQQQLMLRQLTNPAHSVAAHQPLAFMTDFAGMTGSAVPVLPMGSVNQSNLRTSSASAIIDHLDSSEPLRRTKRRRGDRLSGSSEFKMDGDDSDSESGMERYKATKQAKVSAESVPEGDLSDITPLLSLPQKEAAQRLGISESMLCKRFKECTRRKWPFRFLRKIEKTIASLESQKDVEPLSVEDQDRLEDLLRQRIECLAPVKIRITKSPSPVPCSRSSLVDSDSTHHDVEDSDSDDSDTRELDYESEAIENLIHLSRSTTPRSLFAAPTQLAC